MSDFWSDPPSTSILHVCEHEGSGETVRLRGCAASPEPSLVAYVISTIISWACSILVSILITGAIHLSRLMAKPTKWHVRPAKTQISLGIRPVWSESPLCAQWVGQHSGFLHADSKDSDQTGRMPRLIRLRLAHMPFCWFCHEAAHFSYPLILQRNFKRGAWNLSWEW